MTTEQYAIGYEEGYQEGWNAAQQPALQPLTDEQILALSNDCYDGGLTTPIILFARAIERAHGIGGQT